MKKITIITLGILSLTGCAVKKDLYPSGGSKADGTITMSYDYDSFEWPEIDIRQATGIATEKCRLWGYHSAKPFGGQKSKQNRNGITVVDIEYQCY